MVFRLRVRCRGARLPATILGVKSPRNGAWKKHLMSGLSGQERPNAPDGLHQVLPGIGVAEPEVAFAPFPEGGAAETRHARLVQQAVGQRGGMPDRTPVAEPLLLVCLRDFQAGQRHAVCRVEPGTSTRGAVGG